MEQVLEQVRESLRLVADEATRAGSQRYFKEAVAVYGVKSAVVEKLAATYYQQLHQAGKDEILAMCELLWQSGMLEESFIACNWAYRLRSQYVPGDFVVFDRWIHQYLNNWASCDTLCNHTVGAFVVKYPGFLLKLKDFTTSSNRWARRAAAVSLIIPARKGMFLDTIFEIADSLLMDKDDLVQKGYGWMLKAASQAHQDEVFGFVTSRKQQMPRTALRYAIEKMPKELKIIAMAK